MNAKDELIEGHAQVRADFDKAVKRLGLVAAFERPQTEKWVWYYWAHFKVNPSAKWHRTTCEAETREKAESLRKFLSKDRQHLLVCEVTTYRANHLKP